MEKQPAPQHEQQAALDELQQEAKNFDDQLVINELKDEIDSQAQPDAVEVHENHSGNSSEITVTDVSQPEELIATTSKKTGQTHFMVKGVNAETGNTYHRFASKQEVNDALGAFNDSKDGPVEQPANKELFIGERDGRPAAKHMAGETAEPVEAYEPKHAKPETAKDLDSQLRRLVSEYRKTKAEMQPEDLEAKRGEIFAAFEALKTKDGWNDSETAKRHDQLFAQMGDGVAFEPDMSQVNEPEGEVEDVAMPGESKDETMDRVMKSLGAKEVPSLKTDAELDAEHGTEPELDHPVLNGRNDEDFWKEVDQREYQPRHLKKNLLRRMGRRVLISLGLAPDPNQGIAVEAPRVEDAAAEPEVPEAVSVAPKAASASKKRQGAVVFRGAEPAVPEAERSKEEAA